MEKEIAKIIEKAFVQYELKDDMAGVNAVKEIMTLIEENKKVEISTDSGLRQEDLR